MNFQQQVIFTLLAFAPTFLLLAIIWVWILRFQGKSKAPVKDKLLRYPGRTLYQRLERFDDQSVYQLLGILAYGPLCFVLFILYVKLRLRSPHLLAEMICFGVIVIAVTVLLARKAIKALERYRNDALGFRGERAVGEELNKLMLDGCLVYHDVPGEGEWNVDHVVVAPTGVYAIETKTRSKSKCTKDRKDYEVIYDGKTLQYPNWSDTHGLEQAKANAKWLAKHLSNSLAENIKVTPILTLPGWFVTSSVRPSGNELRVLNHKLIRSVIVDGRAPVIIDEQRLKQIGHQLELKCRDVEF
jgi:hypothetical protein